MYIHVGPVTAQQQLSFQTLLGSPRRPHTHPHPTHPTQLTPPTPHTCSAPQHVGNLFNLAKVEQQLGREAQAQELLGEVLARAKGVAGASYMKAWAALKRFTPDQVAEMKDCAQYLRRARAGGGCAEGGWAGD